MSEGSGGAGRVSVGHPVDVASGVVFTAAHDFDLPGTVPLLWRRYFANDSVARTVLGARWTTPFLMTLEVRDDSWELVTENGSPIRFERPAVSPQVGERVLNLPAKMELWLQRDGYTIVHWHNGSSDLEVWHFRGTEGVLPLSAIENAAGHRFSIAHDTARRPVRIVQEIEQRFLGLDYDDRGLLQSVRLERADSAPTTLVRYTYHASGLLATATDAMGSVTRYEYDAAGRLILERNPLGSAFYFRYDSHGRCVMASGDRRQILRKLAYGGGGKLVDVTDSLGHVRRYVLNAIGQVLQQISATGVATTTEYDALGRTARVVNADGTARAYEYDSEGNRIAVTFEDGTTVRMRYNQRHALVAYTDALGAVWQLERDERNQLVAVVNPLGNRFAYPRDQRGFVTATVSPLGRSTRREYGPALRWWEARDEVGLRARYDFDLFGNTVRYHDAAGVRFTVEYDLCNRPTEARDARGRTWRWRYNALGEVTEYLLPNGAFERLEYDTFGQVVAHETPLGVMRLEYDTEGRLTQVSNRSGEEYTRHYDPDGRVAREVFFDGREQSYEWNRRNFIVRATGSGGIELTYGYGPLGEVTSVRSPDGLDLTYRHDPRGSLVAATAPGSRIEFTLDTTGRLVSEIQNGHQITNEYDEDNFCVRRRVLGAEIGFAYDVRGRLTGLADAGGQCQTLRWNALDQPEERRTPQGLIETLSWQRDDCLLAQTVTVAGITRVDRRYTYDDAGYVSTVDDVSDGRRRYRYDAIGRLLSVDGEGRDAERYRYDAIGNIVETHRGRREVGRNGRTLQDGLTKYEYDEAGRLVSCTHPQEGQNLYRYDARGQLRTAIMADGTASEYTYDALWRRCARKVGGRTTEYLYAGCLLTAEHDSAAVDRVFAGIEWRMLAEWRGSARRFVVPDLSNVVRDVLDEHGRAVWKGSFESYGRTISEQGEAADHHRLPGQYSDRVTGLADNFYRTFDPFLGAYLVPDPVGLVGGANHYGYPRNPLRWFDFFGLKCSVAHTTEENMDAHFATTPPPGYDPISPTGKNTNAPGIDRVYKVKSGTGPPEYIIAEAKSGQRGRLGQTKLSEQQMSDTWVNTNIGGRGDDRLTHAVGAADAAAIRTSAATSGNVEKAVFHQPGGTGTPTITTQPYDPSGTGKTF